MLRNLILLIAAVPLCLSANQAARGWCEQGNRTVITGGVSGTPKVQGSYPQCQITVYLSGTLTLATLFSDNSSTPLSNPFVATTSGYWRFYATNGRYDIVMSGAGIGSPFTYGDVLLADPSTVTTPVLSFNGRTGNVVPLTGDYSIGMITGNVVNTFNSRTGTVVPATNDYNFNQLAGTIGFPSQFASVQGNGTKPASATGAFVAGNTVTTDGGGALVDSGRPATPLGTGPYQWFRSGLNPYSGAFSNTPFVLASDMNFAAITPGGTLTGGAGAQAVTLAPCPLGLVVSGTYATSLRLSGGTGTAEVVRPTGGTCTAGAATGTVIIAPANNHSGAWTVTSATSGIQEALGHLSSGGLVWLTPGDTYTLYSYVILPLANYTIDGGNNGTARISRASDYPNGDLFTFNNVSCGGCYYYYLQNFTTLNEVAAAQSTGSAFNMIASHVQMSNLSCTGGPVCWTFDGAGGSGLRDFLYVGGTHSSYAMRFVTVSAAAPTTDTIVESGQIFLTTTQVGISLLSGDGLHFSDIQGSGGVTFLAITPSGADANQYVAAVDIHDFLIDGNNIPAGAQTVLIQSVGGLIGSTRFLGNQINAAGGDYILNIQGDNIVGPLQFENNLFQLASKSCIVLNGTKTYQPLFLGNVITDCNSSNTASTPAVLLNISNADFIGNVFTNAVYGNAQWGIASEGASTKVFLSGNQFETFPTAAVSLDRGAGIYPSSLYMNDNKGIDDSVNAVASAATLALPLSHAFTITGTTTVTATTAGTCWAGRIGTITATAGVVPFTASASIGNTFALRQNVPASYYCDGTKMWLSGLPVYFNNIVGSNVASATTITPSGQTFHVTGTTTIATINLPTGFTGGQLTIIPDGVFATNTAGNIALASTSVVGKALYMTYDPGTSKFYPSY